MPAVKAITVDAAFEEKWNRIHTLRDNVQKALEAARTAKVIGGSLDAKVTLFCNGETLDFVKEIEELLKTVLIVSQVEICEDGVGEFTGDFAGLSVSIAHADGEKCCRCWAYSDTVKSDGENTGLCARCAAILNK